MHTCRGGNTSIHPEQMERQIPSPATGRCEDPVSLPRGQQQTFSRTLVNGLHLSDGTGSDDPERGAVSPQPADEERGAQRRRTHGRKCHVTWHVKDTLILGTVPLPLVSGAPGDERWQQGLRSLLHTEFPAGAELSAPGEGLEARPPPLPPPPTQMANVCARL